METLRTTFIGLGQIEVSTTNKIFRRPQEITDEALSELALSIREHGVMQAIMVRPHPQLEGKYELIFGERRFRASVLAGMMEIPATIKEASDDTAFEIQLTENLQREDVHPLNEAMGYKVILEKNETITKAELATRFGKSETYITQRIKLNDLIRESKKDFLENRMLLGHAIQMARLTSQDQREVRQHIIQRRGSYGTTTELQELIERMVTNNLSSAPFDKQDESLHRKAGACTNCLKRSGASPMLFPEVKDKEKCFDSGCFLMKCNRFLIRRTKEIVETQPEVMLLTDHSEPIEEVTSILKDHNLKSLTEYTDFLQHNSGGEKVKGLWIAGTKAGHTATVFLKKDSKPLPQNEKERTQLQIEKIKQRIDRGKELDKEKVYAKILEALEKHPSQKKGFNKKLMPSEEIMLWYIVLDKASYQLTNTLRKNCGLNKEDPEKLYQQLSKMKPEDKAFLLRKVMLDQYGGNLPESNKGYIIHKIAADYKDIEITTYEKEQIEIQKLREERAKERIKQLHHHKE